MEKNETKICDLFKKSLQLKPLNDCFQGLVLKNDAEKFCNAPTQENADIYIYSYFKCRSKEKLLNAVIMEADKGEYESRSIHMVSAFLLGSYIQCHTNNLFRCKKINKDCKNGEENWNFDYLWFMSCLYHDTFSGTEQVKVNKNISIMDVLYNSTEYEQIHTIYDREIYGIKLPRPTYRKKDVEAYFRYRLDTGHLDHGIKGGYIAFQKLIDNYLEASAANGNQDCFQTTLDGKFRGHVLLWDKKQIEAFAYVADAIIAHNIWHVSDEEQKKIYREKNLRSFIVEDDNECLLSIDKSPLAYLLSLVDTIEPVKYFDKTAEAEDIFNNITIGVFSDKIVIGQSKKRLYNLGTWYKNKMIDMPDWLAEIEVCYCDDADEISITLPKLRRH